MANPDNLVRPPILQNNATPTPQAARNAQLSIDDLTTLIGNIATDIFRQQIPQVVQAALNPNASLSLATDQTIEETHRTNLIDLDRIPDVVKCLKEFSGHAGEFNSWRKSVDRILKIYEPLRGTPKYYGILSVVRNKIVGNADMALESYNTPLDWSAITKCLSMHYADKRDLSTLEYQMTTLIQGRNTVAEFYQLIYKHLSLILDKVGCLEMSNESLRMMTQSYRDRALDTFIRGLNGDLPRLLGIREPVDLPQALQLCLKLDNQNFRTTHAHTLKRTYQNNQTFSRRYPIQTQRQEFYPQLAHMPQIYQLDRQQQPAQIPNINAPPRPPRPQPRPEPMEVDQSIHSRRINYMNRSHRNQLQGKRPPSVTNYQPNKNQRTFHIDTTAVEQSDDGSVQYGEPSDIHFLA